MPIICCQEPKNAAQTTAIRLLHLYALSVEPRSAARKYQPFGLILLKCGEIPALDSWCYPPQFLLHIVESWAVASMLSSILSLLPFFGFACASAVTRRQTITTLSSEVIEAFKPYTLYAATAYCDPSQTLSWSCGGLCLDLHALETSALTLTTTQVTARVTPLFNLTFLAVMGRMSSSVRDFTFLNSYLQTQG